MASTAALEVKRSQSGGRVPRHQGTGAPVELLVEWRLSSAMPTCSN
ncbi:MAG: hypothetical protein MET45_13410 [Nostoc sp. LLA-1]|nr:hypothetical protein [Cyanocohniella sp. LLY]